MAKTNPNPASNKLEKGRYAYEGLERVLHEKARLGIMTSLLSNTGGLLFGELKDLCTLTDGNLSRHLTALKEAGLVEMSRGEKNNRAVTLCRLSDEGRERFIGYVGHLEQVIADATQVLNAEKKAAREKSAGGLNDWTSNAAGA